jgi:phosphonate dehydrogenase
MLSKVLARACSARRRIFASSSSATTSPPPTIFVTHDTFPEVYALLAAHGLRVLRNDSGVALPPARVRELAADADGLLAFMPDRVDAAFLAAAPRLRIVAAALKGGDNFDLGAMRARGVVFTKVPELLTHPTAELAVSLATALARRVPEGDAHVRSGTFAGWRPILFGRGLADASIGIIGLGAVGRGVLERVAGFAPREVLFVDPDPRARAFAAEWARARAALAPAPKLRECATLDELLTKSADFVFPLTHLTRETRRLIGARELALMRPGAFLVNVGRGGCVDEAAVADALARGRLAGYAADVFELEDWAIADRPRDIPAALLRDTARTLFTPHLGSAVVEVRKAIALEAAENLVDHFVRGVRPRGAVDVAA